MVEKSNQNKEKPKKKLSVGSQLMRGIGIVFIIIVLFFGTVFLLAMRELRQEGYDAAVKSQVEILRQDEDAYYKDYGTYTTDLNLLIREYGSYHEMRSPVHEGNDTYGVIIISADENNYKIEGHLSDGKIYTGDKSDIDIIMPQKLK